MECTEVRCREPDTVVDFPIGRMDVRYGYQEHHDRVIRVGCLFKVFWRGEFEYAAEVDMDKRSLGVEEGGQGCRLSCRQSWYS
jgi:hypothetical protein